MGLKILMVEPLGSVALTVYSNNLCYHLAQKGCSVHLITSRPHEFTTNECDSYHYKCVLLKMPEDPAYLQLKLFWAIDRFLRVWINAQRRLKIIRSLQPDIIHIQYSHPLFDLFYLPGLQKKYKLVYTVHDVFAHHDKISFHFAALKRFYTRLDHMILHTISNKEQLMRLFSARPNNFTIIPHGALEPSADLPDKETSRRKLGLPKDKFIILFFGNIRSNKGLDALIEAHSEVVRQRKNVLLVIAGKPTFRDSFDPYWNLIEKLNIRPHIVCHIKFIPEAMVPYYFMASDIVALPYRHFGSQSGVLMQAYQYQRPVIVTDAGGLAEAVREDKVGKIVPRATPDGISEAIIKMMSQREQFNTYAANMLQAIRYKYSWKIIADKTLSCYRDLLSASQ